MSKRMVGFVITDYSDEYGLPALRGLSEATYVAEFRSSRTKRVRANSNVIATASQLFVRLLSV